MKSVNLLLATALGAVTLVIGASAVAQTASSAAPSTAPASTAPPIRGGGVTVEPEAQRPQPPDGDPRSTGERREDHVRFDQCVLKMQSASEDISRPVPLDPVAYCQQKLGMDNANSVPKSRWTK
jgi:hypothetical protein